METHQQQVAEAVHYLQPYYDNVPPEILLILGTGLEKLPGDFKVKQQIAYHDIPHFAEPSTSSHKSLLIYGEFHRKTIAVLSGRLHYYEGFSLKQITLPLRVMAESGCKTMIVSNAAGGLNPDFRAGDLMIINDHLNFMGENPLRGGNCNKWGVRFPDMSKPYSDRLANTAFDCAKKTGIKPMRSGVYVAVAGPSMETAAETRFLRNSGADAVGMSTVPEVIVARHSGMEVLGISIIANCNDPDNFQPIVEREVIAQVQKVEKQFNNLLWEIIRQI